MTIADQYADFGSREARGNSPTYQRLSSAIAASDELLGRLAALPSTKQQPHPLFGASGYRWQMNINAYARRDRACQAMRMIGAAQLRPPAEHHGGLAQWRVVVAAAALVVTMPVATWWLVGDQSTDRSADADYAFEPFHVSIGAERTAGIGSMVVAVAALLVLVRDTRRHRLDPRWWLVLIPLAAAGMIVGLGWRVMTAGVIGANIGAGLAVFIGGPAVAALLIWSAAYAIYLLHRRRIARTRPLTPGQG